MLEEKIITLKDKKISYFFFKKIDIEKDSYGKNSEKLSAIAFVHDENNKLNLKAFRRFDEEKIIEDQEIAQIMKTMINESLNDNHLRVSFSNGRRGNNGYDDEMYYED
jgi:hypothetical protein